MEALKSRRGSYRRALGRALVEAGERCRDVVVLDADTPTSTKTIAFARAFPERFFNIGISEQDLVDTAAGLAIAGKIPVAAAFAMFLMRAWEQVRNTIARDGLNVKLVGTHAGLQDYMDGASHQAFEDVALMRTLPGFAVLVPADEAAVRALVLEAVLNHKGPVYLRLGRDDAPVVYEEGEEFRVGGSKVLIDAVDAVIYAYGPMVGVALEAARILRRQGIHAGVVDVYTVKPIDRETVVRQARKAGLVFTLEDHSVYGGLGSAVAEVLSEEAPTRVVRIGVRDSFGTSARSYPELLEYMGLTPERMAERVRGEIS
ncbi:transketolase family protein [Stetteria hydrogenophila]